MHGAAASSAPAGIASGAAPVEACEQLLARHLDAVHRAWGAEALGLVDLPPLAATRIVAPQLRVAAVLYVARHLEEGGLLPFLEALALGIVRGTVILPLGGAVQGLLRFWRDDPYRFRAPERAALYQRVFDGAGEEPFERRMATLADALSAIGRAPANEGTGHLEARLLVLAQEIGARLSAAASGIAAFAARDIIGQIRAALDVLRHPDVERSLGGGPPWTLVQRHAPALLGRSVDPVRQLSLAHSGLQLLTWIADQAAGIEGGGLRVARAERVIRDAEAWRAANGAA